MMLVPWALIALILSVSGGGYVSFAGARPDLAVAFMVAGSVRRCAALQLVPLLMLFAAVRFALTPVDARGECFALAGLALLVPAAVRLMRLRGFLAAALLTAGAIAVLVTATALWHKAAGAPGTGLPPLPHLGLGLLLTLAYAGAFMGLLPAGEDRP